MKSKLNKKFASLILILTIIFSYGSPLVYAEESTSTPAILDTPPEEILPNDTEPWALVDPPTIATSTDTDTETASTTEESAPSINEPIALIEYEDATSTTPIIFENPSATTTEPAATSTEINTGDSTTVIDITNTENTNTTNSTGTIQTSSSGTINDDLDLTDLISSFGSATTSGITSNASSSASTTDLSITTDEIIENNNVSTTTNDINAESDTGNNEITNNGAEATIETGDATVLANVVNLVNTNIIDSEYLIFLRNILGDLNGDIILPSASFFTDLLNRFSSLIGIGDNSANSTTTIENQNNADVDTNISLNGTTGDNNALNASSSAITTGDIDTAAHVTDLINTNSIGTPYLRIIVNVLGDWTGGVVGLPESLLGDPVLGGVQFTFVPYSLSGTPPSCCKNSTTSENIINNNDASVTNNINLVANTGGNTIDGGGDTSITTGDTRLFANVVNIVNTNIVGMINILGNFNGNVRFGNTGDTTPPGGGGGSGGGGGNGGGGSGGGESTPPINGGGSGNGGVQLTIDKTNNASGPIFPGDTVTYTLVIRNQTSKSISNGSVVDELISPSNNLLNREVWDLGTILPNEEITLVYDVVFSTNATPGIYNNTALVSGVTEEGQNISAKDSSLVDMQFDGIGGSLEEPTTVELASEPIVREITPGFPSTAGGPAQNSTLTPNPTKLPTSNILLIMLIVSLTVLGLSLRKILNSLS
jgi:hypothetical protein